MTFHSGASTPLQYGGGYTDPETDLIYLLARYYDPSTGVFTTPDPLVDVTNQPYAYAGSDPINQTDPTGQCPMCAVLFVGFLSGAGTDLALQMTNNLANGCSAFQNISWGEVLASGVGGAAFDGLGYAVFKSIAYGYRTSSIAAETAGSKLPPAVIGEGMTARVAPYAEKNGYEIYAGVENPQNYTSEELLLHNKAQIETWMSEGRTIHDVGPAPGRDFYPMETSPNYGMEHNLVRGYPGYKPVVLPGEANWLELLGVH